MIYNTKKRRAYIQATKYLGYKLIHPQSRLFALVSDEMIDELTGRQLAIVMDQISKIYDIAYKDGKED